MYFLRLAMLLRARCYLHRAMDSMSNHNHTPPNKKVKLNISASTNNMENTHEETHLASHDSPDIFYDCSPIPEFNGNDTAIQIEEEDDDLHMQTDEDEEDRMRRLLSLEEETNDTQQPAATNHSTRSAWEGVSLAEISRGSDSPQLPPIQHSNTHRVLFELPFVEGQVPEGYPADRDGRDTWDNYHVRMPCSDENKYVVKDEDGVSKVTHRWEVIKQALYNRIDNSRELEQAILTYNTKYVGRWNFKVLHYYFEQEISEEELDHFFAYQLPAIVHLALLLPQLIKRPIPLLRKHRSMTVSFTQLQVAVLVANAFLCTYPRRNSEKHHSEYASFPDINFNRLLSSTSPQTMRRQVEKLKCIFNYLKRVTTSDPVGTVTYSRRYIKSNALPQWDASERTLPPLHVTSKGTIEDHGGGMLQVDFANCYVGGGVLGSGCVQEEIRFAICPELIAARLFTEELDCTEALLVTGVERFSDYSGYGDSFTWTGDHRDSTPRDSSGRLACSVVAIDALHLRRTLSQFEPRSLRRELNKAFVGFNNPELPAGETMAAVATGNWGCGAFNGDPPLKALLQLMAAAQAGRGVAYFTFGDTGLVENIGGMHAFLRANDVTVQRLWRLLCQYSTLCGKGPPTVELYTYLYDAVINKTSSLIQTTLTDSFVTTQPVADTPSTSRTNSVVDEPKREPRTPRRSIPKPLSPEEIEAKLAAIEGTDRPVDKRKKIVIPESSPESTPSDVGEKEPPSSENSGKLSDSIFFGQNRDRLNDSCAGGHDDEAMGEVVDAVVISDEETREAKRPSDALNQMPAERVKTETVRKSGSPKTIKDYFGPKSK